MKGLRQRSAGWHRSGQTHIVRVLGEPGLFWLGLSRTAQPAILHLIRRGAQMSGLSFLIFKIVLKSAYQWVVVLGFFLAGGVPRCCVSIPGNNTVGKVRGMGKKKKVKIGTKS